MSIGTSDDATLASCIVCGDTTPAGVYCAGCQQFPDLMRCEVCRRRGQRPAEEARQPDEDQPPTAEPAV